MATLSKDLTTSYVSLGAGPMMITLEEGHAAFLHIAASSPAADAPAHSLLRGQSERSYLNYIGSENVYAKKSGAGKDPTKLSYTV